MIDGTVRFTDGDLEALAERIADKLTNRAAGELIDAAELARRTGHTREFIYDHAAAFGAIRIGDGSRPRLRFLWPQCIERLVDAPKPNGRHAVTNRPRRRQAKVPLLPIKEESR